MYDNEEELLIFRQSINSIKALANRLEMAEKQNDQLMLLITAMMDTLFMKKIVTPIELEQAISKIVNKDGNTTVH